MNGQAVAKHLENFIENNDREWFGVAAIQRDCRVSYNQAFRVLELGVKQGAFEYDELKPYKYKMVRDDVH